MKNQFKFIYFLIISQVLINLIVLAFLYNFSNINRSIDYFFRGKALIVEELARESSIRVSERYGVSMPEFVISYRFLKTSDTGIIYDGVRLYLDAPAAILSYSNSQLTAYLSHEWGHYVLGHLQHKNPGLYSLSDINFRRELRYEIEADIFSLEFSDPESLIQVIEDLSWDQGEKNARLEVIKGYFGSD